MEGSASFDLLWRRLLWRHHDLEEASERSGL